MSQSNQAGKLHPGIAALIVIVFIGIVTSVVIVVQNNQKDSQNEPSTTTQSSQDTSSQNNDTTSTDVSSYKDGTYSATGAYVSPGGRESIELTVTIKDGVITSTELKQNANDGDAKQYQAAFAGGYKDLVVGKKVDEVKLSRVAGSSLTSNGFNDALNQIKEDAGV